jgi:predicted O-methyltransferase YrrM
MIPFPRLKRFLRDRVRRNRRTPEIATDRPTTHEELLREIAALPENWHGAGACGLPLLRAMAILAPARVLHSAETGCGKSTLLLSHMSQHHTVFCIDDSGVHDSLTRVRESPLLRRDATEFVIGPTQRTLSRHTFANRLQFVLIDGPHGYPFPEMEYCCFYPLLEKGALLVIDDIHIPSIFRLFSFIREDEMFDFLGVAHTTAFFRRNSSPTFDPTGDGWWIQSYNRKRFPVSDVDQDFVPPAAPPSEEFGRLMRRFGHWPDTTR